jgi:hypothetical protein
MQEPDEQVRDRRAYVLLVTAFALVAASLTIYEINLPNFLRERYTVGEWFRGFLEFPRESQGFAVVFYVVALSGLSERRLFSIAAVLSAVGLMGLAILPATPLANDASGIVPGLPMILLVMIHSAGFHLGGTMQRCIILDHGELAGAGTRLGKVGFWTTLAGLAAASAVWSLRFVLPVDFGFFYACGALLCAASVLVMWRAMRGRPEIRPKKRRFVLKRKFMRYYALSALFGVRKQVFITFALWVLVTVYEQPVGTIALLWVFTSLANLVTQPLIGRMIDRFGPRRTLTLDALALIGVCVLYGTSEQWLPPTIALVTVGIVYVCDHVLFFAGAARAVYAGSIADDPQELATTLSLGITIDHVFSMSVPILGGLIWQAFGYEMVFLSAAGVAVVTAVAAAGIRDVGGARNS